MTGLSTFRIVAYSLIALGCLSATTEAGGWHAPAGTATTQDPNATFQMKITAINYSYQQVPLDPVNLVFDHSEADTPYPGYTTYYHTHDPVVVYGTYQAVCGEI
jgi:hypothetical protein